MGEIISFERKAERLNAGNVSRNLAQGKKETWWSAIKNSALLNGPALLRANKGEKPQVITVRNFVADVGVHSGYIAAFGLGPSILSLMMGGAALVRYQQKKGMTPKMLRAANDNELVPLRRAA